MEEALEEEVSHQVLQEDPSVVEVHLEAEVLQEASKYNLGTEKKMYKIIIDNLWKW